MVASGERKEDYRPVTYFWTSRLLTENLHERYFKVVLPTSRPKETCLELYARKYDQVVFKNGNHKNARKITLEFLGLDYGIAKTEWSDLWKGNVFIIKLGNIISTENM